MVFRTWIVYKKHLSSITMHKFKAMVWRRCFTYKEDVDKCQNNIIMEKYVHSQVIYLTGNWFMNWKKYVNLLAMGILWTFLFTLHCQCIYKINMKNIEVEIKRNYLYEIIVYFWYFCGISKTENVITKSLLLFWYISIIKKLN